jgi:hypothetical protein
LAYRGSPPPDTNLLFTNATVAICLEVVDVPSVGSMVTNAGAVPSIVTLPPNNVTLLLTNPAVAICLEMTESKSVGSMVTNAGDVPPIVTAFTDDNVTLLFTNPTVAISEELVDVFNGLVITVGVEVP